MGWRVIGRAQQWQFSVRNLRISWILPSNDSHCALWPQTLTLPWFGSTIGKEGSIWEVNLFTQRVTCILHRVRKTGAGWGTSGQIYRDGGAALVMRISILNVHTILSSVQFHLTLLLEELITSGHSRLNHWTESWWESSRGSGGKQLWELWGGRTSYCLCDIRTLDPTMHFNKRK